MDLSQTIIPNSNQLNADDLIAGPRTIRITGITGGSAEQPVSVSYEGDNGRPYKPSKSMRRILVALYGNDSAACIGRRITLYRDADIKFGGDSVGGIRISHASDIDRPLVMALTLKRGQRAQYRVEPLPHEQSKQPACDLQTLCDIGDSKAGEGLDVLGAWWQSLQPTERTLIGKARLDAWKARAA